VTKFVYQRNLNSTHWVSVEGSTVKIKRFKGAAKKKEKRKKDTLHQTGYPKLGPIERRLRMISFGAYRSFTGTDVQPFPCVMQ